MRERKRKEKKFSSNKIDYFLSRLKLNWKELIHVCVISAKKSLYLGIEEEEKKETLWWSKFSNILAQFPLNCLKTFVNHETWQTNTTHTYAHIIRERQQRRWENLWTYNASEGYYHRTYNVIYGTILLPIIMVVLITKSNKEQLFRTIKCN